MKKFYLICFSIVIFTSCTSKKDSFNTLNFTENSDMGSLRNVRIFEANNKFLSKPILNSYPNKKGILIDTFTIKKRGIYVLDLLTFNTSIYLEKGDLLKINCSSDNEIPTITFEGDNKDANEFIFESKKIASEIFNNFNEIHPESMSENDILKKISNTNIKCEKLFNQNKTKIKDSILQFVKNENKYSFVNLCLFYKYKLNKFSKSEVKTIQIDQYLKTFNDNNLESFNSSSMYRSDLYEFQKSNFNKVSKGKNLNDFLIFLKKNKIHKEIQDYLLSVYATNYFITDYASNKERKNSYDYLVNVLTDNECRNYIYKSYLKYTRQN